MKLPAELGLVMRPGFAAGQCSVCVRVSTADWRAPGATQGCARHSITWRRLGSIVLRHLKCIFMRRALRSASIFSKVVRAIISQKNYNCRYPFFWSFAYSLRDVHSECVRPSAWGIPAAQAASWLALLKVIIYNLQLS